MFELIPYMLELDSEAEVKLIEDFEPGEDGLPKMAEVEYETIIWNYTDLKNKFYPKHK